MQSLTDSNGKKQSCSKQRSIKQKEEISAKIFIFLEFELQN